MADQWDPKLYDQSHAFVNQLAGDLVQLLSPKSGERILDLGCGTGALSRTIADAGALVEGIDSSPSMIARAKQKYPEIDFKIADALTMQYQGQFDAIFSNAALHWITPPETAAGRMFAALKPGGRLVLEMGGKDNVSLILESAIVVGRGVGLDLSARININYFPSIGQYSSVLEAAGFNITSALWFERLTPLSDRAAGLRDWIRMFRPAAESAIPVDLRARFFGAIEDRCRDKLFQDGTWHADYRRLRITAYRPTE